MHTEVISRRYATALWTYARKKRAEHRIYREMTALAHNLETVPGLRVILCDPIVSDSRKRSLLCDSAGGNASKTFSRFIALVIRNKREENLYVIGLIYLDMYRKCTNCCRATLTTATALSPEVSEAVKQLLANRPYREVQHADQPPMEVQLLIQQKPEILGGFILEIDSWVLDASVGNRLIIIRQQLLNKNNPNN